MAEEASDSMSVTPINKDNEVSSFTQLACPVTNADCRPIEIRDFRVGSGETAILGSTLTLKWTGRLADRYGWPFQRETDEPVVIVLGKDRLIEGFEKGIEGMRAGGKRRIVIPGEFGYRSQEDGPLPSDFGDRRRLWATVLNPRRFKRAGDLVIDVQLKKVRLSGTAK